MKLIDCRSCGSRELVEAGGVITCAYCQSTYLAQAEDAPVTESAIGVHADIAALLLKCQHDPANAKRYANLILDIDPTNAEARKYLNPVRKKRW